MGKPNFLIIGAQRCGTTSVYNYLTGHKQVLPASQKEVHFFDLNFGKGMGWYESQFPNPHDDQITGEASPYYLFHPHVPRRVHAALPSVKLIVLLRNPVDRAYSHYHHEIQIGAEKIGFEVALQAEDERLCDELVKLRGDEGYYSYNHQHLSYLARGIYVDQLRAWRNLVPTDQVLVIRSEDLYQDPQKVMDMLTRFLRLERLSLPVYKRHNELSYPAMNSNTRAWLVEFFRPHNRRLYEYLGHNFNWDA